MKINISNLAEGNHFYELEGTIEEIGLESPFTGNVRAEVKIEKSFRQLHAVIAARANAHFECDRCLKEFDRLIENTFHAIYVWDANDAAAEENDEYHVLSEGVNMINIAPEVREYLLLAVPVKVLCREDCKGLCPICGNNLNDAACECENDEIDDRWSVLKKLKTSEN
ncbi:MAG: DUF177 domain-containing protein [Bacteroidetes bacterium]|nr:DUF177 domain-containing protein [Bacteroidota bacterium]